MEGDVRQTSCSLRFFLSVQRKEAVNAYDGMISLWCL